MHAKLLQSCLTLCNRMDGSPPGSSVYGDSIGKNTGVGCHALLQGIFLTQGSNPHPYMTTGKIIAFLPRSKCLLISWLQSPSAVILEPKKIKSVTVSIVSPSICHEVIGPEAMILVF